MRYVPGMFLGHYGIAFAARVAAPRTSLGATILAAQFLDLLWPVLLLAGVEHVRIVPGLMAASDLDFVSYPVSHSLATVLGWAAATGLVYLVARRDRRSAAILAAAVASHWVLDALMHRPDLPLWPGGAERVGLGLWASLPATYVLEFGFLAAGLDLYVRATRPLDHVGRWGLWGMVALLVASMLGARTPPPDERALALVSLSLWLLVPWGWWVDSHREPRVRAQARAADVRLSS